tara:strand:- start:1182 stop:1304 length:123 start_codon:yes stop_codon:yes gene_type:complete
MGAEKVRYPIALASLKSVTVSQLAISSLDIAADLDRNILH